MSVLQSHYFKSYKASRYKPPRKHTLMWAHTPETKIGNTSRHIVHYRQEHKMTPYKRACEAIDKAEI